MDAVTVRALLGAVLKANEIVADPAELAICATDVFYQSHPPFIIIRTQDKDRLAAAVALLSSAGIAMAPRGGGLSYSKGYLPDAPHWVSIDTRPFDDVVEVNTADMYVTLGAGCTWVQLRNALKPYGLRTPFWGPASGAYSTIGGTLSQNAVLFGSGHFGTAADSVLAMEVVTAQGKLLRVGLGQLGPFPSPFGPGLTSLFIGDGGALGIKVEATLKLMPVPQYEAFAAFHFADASPCIAAMSAIGHAGLASECFAFDPGAMTRTAGPQSETIQAAAGRAQPKDAAHPLHVAIEGRGAAEAEEISAAVQDICLAHGGAAAGEGFLGSMKHDPFPPPRMMAPADGRRWVPVHMILPHSRFGEALARVNAYMDANAALIEAHQIEWGYSVLLLGTSSLLLEPNLYWRDSRHALIESHLDREILDARPAYPENLPARSAVARLREGLAQCCAELNAAHIQLGRLFPYGDRQDHESFRLLQAIKDFLDPAGLMNPGVLGLNRTA